MAEDRGERAPEEASSPHRLAAFSDAVIAVIITIMVLELRAPDAPTLAALAGLWPTFLSYAVSYLFIAIIWINHHHLMRFVSAATAPIIWLNFLHLFLVALVPFATQWVARTSLGAAPVMVYALVFVCVDVAYLLFERAVMAQADCSQIPDKSRRPARLRSMTTVLIFAAAALAANLSPALGLSLICLALSFFIRPEGAGMRRAPPGATPG